MPKSFETHSQSVLLSSETLAIFRSSILVGLGQHSFYGRPSQLDMRSDKNQRHGFPIDVITDKFVMPSLHCLTISIPWNSASLVLFKNHVAHIFKLLERHGDKLSCFALNTLGVAYTK